jgi:hypothetical protein
LSRIALLPAAASGGKIVARGKSRLFAGQSEPTIEFAKMNAKV